MSGSGWVAVAVFAIAYVLIATEKVHRVAAALGGAVVMLLVGATDAEHAFFSETAGIDWNVIFLLVGMMLIVAVLKRTGAFEYVAIWATKRAGGRPFRVMVLLVLVTAVASAFLDNVTTVLLVAPVTFLVCERLDVPVAPFLIAEVMASNIGGTSTLVGDPPNIIIASRGGLSYNDFLFHLAPFVALLVVVFLGLCRVLFRSAFRYDPERAAQIALLRERDAIQDGRLLVLSGVVLVLVTAAFVLHTVLHLEPSVVAIVGGLALLALSRMDAGEAARDVEWPTLVFFAGLFVMVGALVNTGVIEQIAGAATDATGGRLFLASMLLLWGSAVLSAVVDNIPYVATMSPVVADMVRAEGGTSGSHVLWWALALGADLGGNATAIGASANVVVLGLAERSGRPITFWQFTRYGLVVTAVTVALAVPYLWLRYFAFS
ncbi:ArsB/NhaD family transporter [Phytohabitans sp. ZYX-F-186]|uniref:ArsB/NhaD family transporter n=1 Tax=Phytohabitans maris TaxID=3071409 RepID=A0ABU0ZDD4_9ACTN|nr:ArsB/NhaD family transporter [Phytohabitans sp. ZYX-F-186]MDQ7905069.1 ArsB/NhaD family transporter [Phytohabitans sp. ZYX-F-186]